MLSKIKLFFIAFSEFLRVPVGVFLAGAY